MKLFNKIRSLGRKTKVAVAAVVLTAAVALPLAVNAEFYPVRPVYDYNKSGNGNCADPANPARDGGRCGSLNGPVFNSFINTPSYGDERAFFDGRRSDQTAASNVENIQNVNQGSKEVILRTYVHNNANQATNGTNGVAKDAKVRVALPTATEQVLRARSYISASNAAMVEDTVDLTGTQKFNVSYVPGSAKLLRGTASYALSDSIVTTGAPIGDTTMNGNLPGCFDYAALVEIKVKINVQENPNIGLTKQVRKYAEGQKGNWAKEVTVKPGEDVEWVLDTKNTGKAPMTDVVTRDVLPPHVQLVSGSVKFTNANGTQPLSDGPLFQSGYNSGKYNPNDNSLITFKTKTLGDFEGCEIRVRNVAYAHSAQIPQDVRDDADVVIKKENCKPEKPVYSCDLLTATKTGTGREVKFTAKASASGGATVKRYIYNFGDGSAELTTDKSEVTYTYAKDGQFAARVKVQVSVGNETKIVESDKCAAAVTFSTTTPVTPTTPTTPGKLPDTGAGGIIATFIAVTSASAAGYYVLARRFARI